MARQTQTINVGGQCRETWKITGAITDVDVGKPVKIASTDLLVLCSDGDQIYGFIDTVEAGGTSDGKVVVTIVSAGRMYAILSGGSTFGGMVEAAANEVAGTAKAGTYGLVSTHTVVTATEKMWKIISGAVTDGATVLLEKQ